MKKKTNGQHYRKNLEGIVHKPTKAKGRLAPFHDPFRPLPRGYSCPTVEEVTEKMIAAYIASQEKASPKDAFTMSEE